VRHVGFAFEGAVGHGEVAAGSERVHQAAHDSPGVFLVLDEVHHGDEQQGYRLGEVDQAGIGDAGEHGLGGAQIGLDDGGAGVAGQDGLAVRDGDGVDVGVDHAGVRGGLLGDLVDVARGGYPRSDVDELADAGRGEEPDGPAEEPAVGLADRAGVRLDRDDGPAHVLVGQEVVGAAHQVVVDPRDVRAVGVDPRRHPVRLTRRHALPQSRCVSQLSVHNGIHYVIT
jgi:hypothetical protein